MSAAKVTIYMRVSLPNSKRPFLKPVFSGNQKLKEGWAIAKGQPKKYADYAYYLRYVQADGKRGYERLGTDAQQAQAAKLNREIGLAAVAQGFEVAPKAVALSDKPGRSLADAIAKYLKDVERTKKPGTLEAYKIALRYFVESCSKSTLEQIDREDMLQFSEDLKKQKGQSERSTYNKFKSVLTFLRAMGITGIVGKGDWPDYDETTPEIYEAPELAQFLAACTAQERLWFTFFLFTGMREAEVAHTAWSDINFEQSSVTVTAKPEFNWSPKNRKERGIPVPSSLMDALAVIKPERMRGLIFGSGTPKTTFLDHCKEVAVRARLDPEDCWLHKFRATFATMHLRAGVDLRTVQAWMGHTDLASTMRYLKPAEGELVRQKVNATFSSFGNSV